MEKPLIEQYNAGANKKVELPSRQSRLGKC
jgi:hypothetical protein